MSEKATRNEERSAFLCIPGMLSNYLRTFSETGYPHRIFKAESNYFPSPTASALIANRAKFQRNSIEVTSILYHLERITMQRGNYLRIKIQLQFLIISYIAKTRKRTNCWMRERGLSGISKCQ